MEVERRRLERAPAARRRCSAQRRRERAARRDLLVARALADAQRQRARVGRASRVLARSRVKAARLLLVGGRAQRFRRLIVLVRGAAVLSVAARRFAVLVVVVVASVGARRGDRRRGRRARSAFRAGLFRARRVRASAASVPVARRLLCEDSVIQRQRTKAKLGTQGLTERGGVCVATDSFLTEARESTVPVESGAATPVPFDDDAVDSCPGDFT